MGNAPTTKMKKTKPKLFIDVEAMKNWPVPYMKNDPASAELKGRPHSHFRVVTWNVWFDPLDAPVRMQALLHEVFAAAPDFACLQEVVPEFAWALRACEALTAVYDISPFEITGYDCLILARHDVEATFSKRPFEESLMGRGLLYASCHARWPGLMVATTHLESLNYERIRRLQLEVVASVLMDSHVPAVLCGDMNFDSSQSFGDWDLPSPARTPEQLENVVLAEVLPEFVDAWPSVRSDEGFTFDGVNNRVCG